MAEKLSDLTASHTPVPVEISIELSPNSLTQIEWDSIITIVFGSITRVYSNGLSESLQQTYKGTIDAKMIPYICFRLETVFDSEDETPELLEAIGRIERYLKKVYSDYFPEAKPDPVDAAKAFAKLTMPNLKAQAEKASKAIKEQLGELSKKLEKTTPEDSEDLLDESIESNNRFLPPTEWTSAKEDEELAAASQSFYDDVAHPSYYDLPSGMESKDVIRQVLGDEGYEQWCLGTSLKYLFRYPNKENPVKDLNKAKQYIDFILELRQEED